MLKSQTQQDLIAKYKRENTEKGKDVVDRIKIPGLEKVFIKYKGDSNLSKERHIRLPKLTGDANKEDVASVLTQALSSHSDTTEIKWTLENQLVEVYGVDHFKQKSLTEEDLFDIKSIILLVLRMRPRVKAAKWTLGNKYIELTYVCS